MFQGVEYFSISQARPGETFLSDRAGSKWWFSMRGNLPKMIQPSQTIRVFYHIVESLYVSIASFQYRTGNMVGRSPEFANLRLNGSAQPRTTSSMEGWCVSTDHPTVTLILVNGVWVQYIESIKIVVFVLRVRVATISVQWLFLLHWYHHFFDREWLLMWSSWWNVPVVLDLCFCVCMWIIYVWDFLYIFMFFSPWLVHDVSSTSLWVPWLGSTHKMGPSKSSFQNGHFPLNYHYRRKGSWGIRWNPGLRFLNNPTIGLFQLGSWTPATPSKDCELNSFTHATNCLGVCNIVEFSIKSSTDSTQQIDKANCGIFD